MIGIKRNIITVQQLYDYAVLHNYLETDTTIVLDIINRERNQKDVGMIRTESNVSPINNTSTIDFSNIVEFSYDDLIALLST